MRSRLLAAAAGTVAALALATPAWAATAITLNPAAVYLNPQSAEFSGTVTCPAGTAANIFVSSRQALPYASRGSTQVTCTGLPQTWTVRTLGAVIPGVSDTQATVQTIEGQATARGPVVIA